MEHRGSKSNYNPALVDPDEPVDEITINGKSYSGHSEAVRRRRTLADVPMDRNLGNLMAVVVAWSIYGLSDKDIGSVLGQSEDKVSRLKNLPDYESLRNAVITNIQDHELDKARGKIADAKESAAQVLVDGLEAGNLGLRMSAANKILELNGINSAKPPADMSGLVIQIVHRDKAEKFIQGDH